MALHCIPYTRQAIQITDRARHAALLVDLTDTRA
jgi:hypothetical protein